MATTEVLEKYSISSSRRSGPDSNADGQTIKRLNILRNALLTVEETSDRNGIGFFDIEFFDP